MKRNVFLLLGVLFVFNTCTEEFSLRESKVDLTKDWEETVAVFSNINLNSRKHYIRVSRGFSVDNFFTSNTNPDSIYFDPSEIDVTLYKLRVNNIFDGEIVNADTLNTYVCRDTLIPKDSTGYFTTEKVPVFYFENNGFYNGNENVVDLYIGVEITTPLKKVTSYTKVVEVSRFVEPSDYLDRFPIENSTFGVTPRLSLYAQIFRVEGYCSYFEIREIGGDKDTLRKTFSFLVGTLRKNDPVTDYGESNRWIVSTEVFYGGLERDIIKNGDTVNTIARILDGIYFICYAGNADLALFSSGMSISSTGFNDEPVLYSNIYNGLGTLSAYGMIKTKKFPYSYPTIDSVVSAYGVDYHFIRAND